MEANILDNGNLELYLPENEREETKDRLERFGELDTWNRLFEPYYTNGIFEPIDPDHYFVGLTSDPYIIIEDAALEDNGDLTVYGSMWHYPNYMLESVVEKLLEGEKVQLQKHCEFNGELLKQVKL